MKMQKKLVNVVLLLFLISITVGLFGCAKKQTAKTLAPKPKNPNLILATTTSTQDTGLLDVLVPMFEKQTGYTVKTIAVGTGQALAMGQKGEADVLLCHAPATEKPLVDDGTLVDYKLVMHNDFVVIGPTADPAGIKGMKSPSGAFKQIAAKKALFITRGDNSGTQIKELAIWKAAGITPSGSWYPQSGQGMGQTITMASDKQAYTLSDRGTYMKHKKTAQLDILVEGDKSLLNIYHVMEVSSTKFPKVNKEGAKAFDDFMVNPNTQKVIAGFGKKDYGAPLFTADAGKNAADLGK
jgi:tungstate transport system substrate-binding protein